MADTAKPDAVMSQKPNHAGNSRTIKYESMKAANAPANIIVFRGAAANY